MKADRRCVRTWILQLLPFICLIIISGCGRGTETAESAVTAQIKNGEWFYNAFDIRQKNIYDAFRISAEDPFGQQLIPITDDNGQEAGIPVGDIDTVYQGFIYDHPEMFWLGQTYSYRFCGSDDNGETADAVAVIPIPETAEELAHLNEEFAASADRILEKIGEQDSDEEFARSVYDLLAGETEYTGEAMYDDAMRMQHTAYGAIVDKKAVCDGFALAYRYLLSLKGIPCLVVPGVSEGNPHTWNIAEWDGHWHEADLTWDASLKNESGSRYFDLTTGEMHKDHTRETEGIAALIPETDNQEN